MREARLGISRQALHHNLQLVRSAAPYSRVLTMVKADAYGHGARLVAETLAETDGFGVAYLDEALALRAAGIQQPMTLLEGVFSDMEMFEAVRQRCAVVGIGQTKHDTMRIDVSVNGLVREAVDRAMKDADVSWKDIDAIVVGKAPDMFEGTMMPELYLADALAAGGKPVLRVHTAGSVGGSTGIVAASLIKAGVHERVLVVTYEKQSEGNAMWALTVRMPFQQAIVAGAGGYFAPLIRAYIARSGAPARRTGCA